MMKEVEKRLEASSYETPVLRELAMQADVVLGGSPNEEFFSHFYAGEDESDSASGGDKGVGEE